MSDRSQVSASQIRELKVSGHTMTLEPGLYCVYNAPGGPAASEAGLPGVRITPAPAAALGRGRGQITVSTFAADGWIGADSAALVRVTEGAADLLVTVYQAQDSGADAPKLQVVVLAGAAAAVQPAAQPAAPQIAEQAKLQQARQQEAAPPSVEVVAHIYGQGDKAGRLGDWMGEPGSQRWIEGFGIAAPDGIAAGDIEYQAVLGRGWLSPWSEGGNFCGSRGMSLPILGLRVRLRGEAAKTHRVALSASFVDGTRVGPVTDSEPCEAASLAALEAFQVSFEPVQAARPARTEAKRGGRAAKPVAVKPEPPAPAPRRAKAKAEPEPKPAPTKARAAAKPVAAKPATAKAKPAAPAPLPAKPAARGSKRTPATTRRR